MDNFEIKNDIFYAIDQKGVAVLNRKDNSHTFINYPEAAVWLVLSEKHETGRSFEMLRAILNSNETDTQAFIRQLMNKWRNLNLIY
jgi:hypothetical protein